MVRGRARSPRVGLFQTDSHRIADIPHCFVHHPVVNPLAAALKRAIRTTDCPPYADAAHQGLVRAVQVVAERRSGQAQVVVVTNSDSPDPAAALLECLREEAGDALHSLWWNGNPERSNVILGPHWQNMLGPEAVCESIGGADVFFPPGAFGQSHLDLGDELVAKVHASITRGSRVVEYYAGSGAIGLGLLARGERVVFNELNPHGLRGLELGLAALPPAARAAGELLPGSAGRHSDALAGRDVAIVDPPRKGLDSALRDALPGSGVRRLVYVSCDVASLTADARALVADGGFALREITPFAFFPFTQHVETLALFDRA
jgi:tRNA/tmRNA/rRNA uracil-C5-methylase (TrmA/RlmC/RlmD family)